MNEPRQPRRLRFTLRLMLAAITALGIGLGVWTHRAREQRRIVSQIEGQGGTVLYDFEYSRRRTPPSIVPQSFYESLGRDYFHNIHSVFVKGDIEACDIARFTSLRDLTIWNEGLTDDQFANLSGLRNLERLAVQSNVQRPSHGYPATTGLGDPSLAVVGRLPRLREVVIHGRRFTRVGLDSLARSKSLESIQIKWCDPLVTAKDVGPLRQRPQAQRIEVLRFSDEEHEEVLVDWRAGPVYIVQP